MTSGKVHGRIEKDYQFFLVLLYNTCILIMHRSSFKCIIINAYWPSWLYYNAHLNCNHALFYITFKIEIYFLNKYTYYSNENIPSHIGVKILSPISAQNLKHFSLRLMDKTLALAYTIWSNFIKK